MIATINLLFIATTLLEIACKWLKQETAFLKPTGKRREEGAGSTRVLLLPRRCQRMLVRPGAIESKSLPIVTANSLSDFDLHVLRKTFGALSSSQDFRHRR